MSKYKPFNNLNFFFLNYFKEKEPNRGADKQEQEGAAE